MNQAHINIPDTIIQDIISLGREHNIQKIILFGSRARGDHKERSDIDLAILGGNTTLFTLEIDDKVRTLLMFDVVNLGQPIQKELLESIEREGIILYEESRKF